MLTRGVYSPPFFKDNKMTDNEMLIKAKGRALLGVKYIKKTITSMQNTVKKLLSLNLVTETSGYDKMIEGLGVAIEYLNSDQGIADIVLNIKEEIENEK